MESLRDANHILELVQKGLTEYLEMKRCVFPRFFFLSDDELLEILSQAKNPLAVQPHLRKCFENIAKVFDKIKCSINCFSTNFCLQLTFEEDLHITQMWSAEEECIDLIPSLYPTANVEDWLLVVETTMRNTGKIISAS